jgi:hypothetical protein
MRGILAGILCWALLAATGSTIWAPTATFAQQGAAAEPRTAELRRLWESVHKTSDPQERITLSERALEIERGLAEWPLPVARDEAKARLWWLAGVGRAALAVGDKAENIEQALAAFQHALQVFTRERSPNNWATLQNNLGNAYRNRVRGDSADNVEKAIAAYEAALTIRTREAGPREWAGANSNLGNAYGTRIRGDRGENLEKAIAAHEAALTVYTRESLPADWAQMQRNLGTDYLNRIRGERADNVERAIAAFEAALTVYTRETLARDWAATQSILGNAYGSRIRGDRADNLEKAIAAREAALTVRSRDTLPTEWAQTQRSLGTDYVNRVRGDRADNLEKAIAAYEAALTVYTRAALPRDWATTQSILGNAYGRRVRGDRADNLEKAIAAHEEALTVFTRETLPLDWARAQGSLGVAYMNRVRGDRTGNLESAIAAYEAALTIYTRETLPRDWATTQSNLGTAYWNRIRGDRADNMDKAIAAFEAALTVRTRDSLPMDWAGTQTSLGIAYDQRIRGDRADNIEKAIAAYEAALTVFTREALPLPWANTLSNLSIAYWNRMTGDRAVNMEKAIAAAEAALTVRTRDALPIEWASTQDNLGIAYSRRIRGDRADNMEKAIAAHESVLTVRTRDALPIEWARTQLNLGIAYRSRIRGSRADNLDKAVAAYQAALTVHTREALPRLHLATARELGGVLLRAGHVHNASAAYASAREAFLLLFGEGLNEEDARDLIGRAGPLFAEAAFAAAQAGDGAKALELASESKARLLAVSLRLQGLSLPAGKRARLEAVRDSIRQQSHAYDSASGLDRSAALEKLAALRGELLALMQEAGKGEARSAGGIMAGAAGLVPAGGAIVVPIVTDIGGKLLIVTKGVASGGVRPSGSDTMGKSPEPTNKSAGPTVSDPKGLTPAVIDLPELTAQRLGRLMRGDGKVGASGGWLGAFNVQYLPERERNARMGEWAGAIERIGPELWGLFAGRLHAALQERGLKPGARIVWLPTSALGLLPIGLAEAPAGGVRFGATYEISVAPSLEALAEAARQVATARPPSLAAIANPTGDLPFTEVEAALVASHFTARPRIAIDKASATPAAVLAALGDKSYWHFASHGFFNWRDARKSGLMMRDGAPLSIGALLDAQGALGRPRLVVLSACETGLYDIRSNPDEFVGLPSTFMQLGAAGVLATLWQVDDLATSLLLAKFYDLHLGQGLVPPAALRQAQVWLRSARKAELVAYARGPAGAARLDPARLNELESEIKTRRPAAASRLAAITRSLKTPAAGAPGDRPAPAAGAQSDPPPFSHPYYWGGFVYTGL